MGNLGAHRVHIFPEGIHIAGAILRHGAETGQARDHVLQILAQHAGEGPVIVDDLVVGAVTDCLEVSGHDAQVIEDSVMEDVGSVSLFVLTRAADSEPVVLVALRVSPVEEGGRLLFRFSEHFCVLVQEALQALVGDGDDSGDAFIGILVELKAESLGIIGFGRDNGVARFLVLLPDEVGAHQEEDSEGHEEDGHGNTAPERCTASQWRRP